jgi:hypothetical protein
MSYVGVVEVEVDSLYHIPKTYSYSYPGYKFPYFQCPLRNLPCIIVYLPSESGLSANANLCPLDYIPVCSITPSVIFILAPFRVLLQVMFYTDYPNLTPFRLFLISPICLYANTQDPFMCFSLYYTRAFILAVRLRESFLFSV